MVKTTKNKLLLGLSSCLFASSALAAGEISTNTAQMQAMDKITGRVSVIEVPVNGEARYGTFSIVVRDCKTNPPEDTPENYAFVDVADNSLDGTQLNIFKGWMISSSPALNPVEHPIHDVWLLKCINSKVDKSKLLSSDELRIRDELPQREIEEAPAVSIPEAAPKAQEEALPEPSQDDNKLEEVVIKDTIIVNEVVEESIPQVVAPEPAPAEDNGNEGPQSLLNFDETPKAAEPQVEIMEEFSVGEEEIIEEPSEPLVNENALVPSVE